MELLKTIKVVLFFSISLLWSQEAPKRLLETLKNYQTIENFVCNIQQENFFSLSGKSKVYTGKFYFTKKRLLVKYNTPSKQLVYCDKSKTIIYISKSNQKIIAQPTLAFRPNEVISQYLTNAKNFTLKESPLGAIFEFVPSQNQEQISTVLVQINPQNLISKIVYGDEKGNTTSFLFTNIDQNIVLNDDIFNLDISQNAQIIDNRL